MTYQPLELQLSLRTVSEANTREHYMKKARRVKQHRSITFLCLSGTPCLSLSRPVEVTLTRIAPRRLDDDNLRGALKAVRDGVADALFIKDNDPSVYWRYDQDRGKPREYAVKISISEVPF